MSDTLQHVLQRNVEWAADRLAEDPEYFTRLVQLQAPEYLWIGCSDSRVPANVITGLEPGEVFVHRNVANIVYAADLNCMSVVQFAVEALKVKHIIVCGHYGCGGVRSALVGGVTGLIDHWLEPIRELARLHRHELEALALHERVDRLCELNVHSQVRMLENSPIIQRARVSGQELHLHGWVYGLNNGLLKNLAGAGPPPEPGSFG